MSYFDTNKKLNHNNWSSGGTHITNFDSSELLNYGRAIEEYNKTPNVNELTLSPFAYYFKNHEIVQLVGSNSLHALKVSMDKDLTKFWDIYDSLKEKNKKV